MKELWQLFITFFKIGTATFGGGYAMIPAIRRETVAKRHWSMRKRLQTVSPSVNLFPELAVNVAIFIGNKVKGIVGAAVACFALVFLLILLFF